MKFCPNCGTLTYEETEICPGCGAVLREVKRYCPNCGNAFSPGDNYCMYCGADVSGIPLMLNGSTDNRSKQKPKKPKRHRIRRFLVRLFEILLILAAILWCVAYYEDYDLRLKVYDTLHSASEIVPSMKSVLGFSDEEPPDDEVPAAEEPDSNDDETVVVETPGDARKVDIVTIVIVNQAKEAALKAEDGSENDIDPDIEADGEDENFGDISEFRMPERSEDSGETDESGAIEEFRLFRATEESDEPDGSGESDEAEEFDEPGIPEQRERHEKRQLPSRHRPDRPQPSSMPPQRPEHRPESSDQESE